MEFRNMEHPFEFYRGLNQNPIYAYMFLGLALLVLLKPKAKRSLESNPDLMTEGMKFLDKKDLEDFIKKFKKNIKDIEDMIKKYPQMSKALEKDLSKSRTRLIIAESHYAKNPLWGRMTPEEKKAYREKKEIQKKKKELERYFFGTTGLKLSRIAKESLRKLPRRMQYAYIT